MGKIGLELLKKAFGSKFVQKILGTRTNVTKLPIKNDPRKVMYDAEKLSDDTAALMLAKDKIKELAPYVARMNDAEAKMYETNLKAILMAEGKLDGIEQVAKGEVLDIKTGKKVDDKGIMSLEESSGQQAPPGTLMGNLETKINQLRSESKTLEDLMNENPVKAFEDYVLKNPMAPGGALDPADGITRTAVRSILEKQNIDIPKGEDPIEVFRKNFGTDVLGDVYNMSEDLLEIEARGGTYKDLDKILDQEGFFNIKPRKDPPQGMTDEEMIKFLEDDTTPPRDDKADGGLSYLMGM